MFSDNATRPPPPSGRPPPYAFVTRVYKRTLRPVVIFTGILTAVWALVWAVDAFQDISPHNQFISTLGTFDIVLGSLYIGIAVIEAFGIFAAVKSTISLVRIYAIASLVALLLVTAAEILHVILHFKYKGQLIDECTKELTGQTLRRVSFWDVSEKTFDADSARDYCNDWWNRGTFRDIAWLLVAVILGLLFVSIAFSFYRQVLDPSSVRTTTNVYRMDVRPMYPQQNGPIPGYAPYNPYPDYVPAYDPHKPPNYSQGGWTGPAGDEKEGYGYGAGAGASSTTNLNAREERDEGFDPTALQAAMKASEQESAAKTNLRNDDRPGGSGGN